MKRISSLILMIITCCAYCVAQPQAVKNAAKGVVKLTTYNEDGTILAQSNAVVTDDDGTVVGALKPFIGAARATLTDAKGRIVEVTRMLGVDELYDMAKFKADGLKAESLPIASSAANQGDAVWLVSTAGGKSGIVAATVKGVETFMDKYSYYIFTLQVPEHTDACPFVNAKGEVIGLLQTSATSTDIHAADANYAFSLQTSALSLNDANLRRIGIAPALPKDRDQAMLMLMMAQQSADSAKLAAIATDFTAQYPTLIDGYTTTARMQANANAYEKADNTMKLAISRADDKSAAHAGYGKLIYDNAVYRGDSAYAPWTLEKAADETAKAYALDPQPTYKHQQGQILFAQGEYQQAYDTFSNLIETTMRDPQLFYEAAQCKAMLNAPQTEIIALLDSAINNTDTLRIREAAPYFLARGDAYNAADSFRQAVFDYTRYEILVNGRVNAQFYYVRSQAEIKARLYQQALSDMAAAIILAPNEPTYYAEMASLQLKVNLVDDAIKTAERCVEIAPEYSDGYLLLGLAQVSKGDKTAGLPNLEKAKELGNTQAQPLIDKYQ